MAQEHRHLTVPAIIPAGAPEDGDGVVLGTGPATVDIYIDFLCPHCRRFEDASSSALEALSDGGLASLRYHPLGFLDRLSSTRYSSRAAAASGCASDRDSFVEYKAALFANQPEEGGPGLSDDVLAQLGSTLGLDAGFARCISEGRYLDWSAYVSARAIERGVSGTPSVFVDGTPVPADARAITAAIKGPGL